MVGDRDIWRAADLLTKRHGSRAASIATERANEMLKEGDAEGLAVWRRIAEATEELLRERPDKGEAVN